MFDRAHHRRIEKILRATDAKLLASHDCFFGGGTALVLAHGEYRESNDIDLIVSDRAGYRSLRAAVKLHGLAVLFDDTVGVVREARTDQYGIRGAIAVDQTPVKFEIIHEGRIELITPAESDNIAGVVTLAPLDAVTTKILANDDLAERAEALLADPVDEDPA